MRKALVLVTFAALWVGVVPASAAETPPTTTKPFEQVGDDRQVPGPFVQVGEDRGPAAPAAVPVIAGPTFTG